MKPALTIFISIGAALLVTSSVLTAIFLISVRFALGTFGIGLAYILPVFAGLGTFISVFRRLRSSPSVKQ